MFLLNKLRKQVESADKVGIAISESGMALAHVEPSTIGKPYLTSCVFYKTSNEEEYLTLAKKYIEENGLYNKACVLVIPQSQYDTYLMEPVEVKEEEKASALAWQLKDYLDYPVENASVDYFDIPHKEGVKPMIYAIAANKRYIEKQAGWINLLDLNIESVTIPELAIRNIAALLPENKEGLAFIHPTMTNSEIAIVKNSFLYILRNTKMDLSSIINEGYDIDEAVLEQLLQELSLEVQRAIDYCKSSIKHVPVKSIVVSPQALKTTDESSGYKNVADIVGLKTRIMKLEEVMKIDNDVNAKDQSDCIVAAAATLRYIELDPKLNAQNKKG